MKTQIPTPSNLFIGDPWYEEKYPNKRFKELTFQDKFPQTFVSSLCIETNEFDGLTTIRVCIAPDKRTLALYEDNRYPAHFNEKVKVLGCDTACFEIETQDKYVTIGTMADGFFGDVHRFTYNRKCQGVIISLFIDSKIFDARMEQEIKYVFSEDDENEIKSE